MGIKDFTKAFKATRVVKPSDMRGQTIAVDAMAEIYRATHGTPSIKTLTDKNGEPTNYINVILANVLEMKRNGVNQLWVFDHDSSKTNLADFHNPDKIEELQRRRAKRAEAQKQLDALNASNALDSDDDIMEKSNLPMFDYDANDKKPVKQIKVEDEDDTPDKPELTKEQLEKRVYVVNKTHIENVQFILSCLNIRYTTAPAGFEGECIASHFNINGMADAVYSPDADTIPCGALVLYKKNNVDKKIYEYTQADILKQIADANDTITKPTIDDIRKVCVALKCEHAPKTPGIGAKTVLTKLHKIVLTDVQKHAIDVFRKVPDINSLPIVNADKTPFVNDNREALIEWLVDEKSFKRDRIQAWFDKPDDTIKAAKVAKKAKPAPKAKVAPKAKSPLRMPKLTKSMLKE